MWFLAFHRLSCALPDPVPILVPVPISPTALVSVPAPVPVPILTSSPDPFNAWGGAGSNNFVPVLGGDGTKIAPNGDIFGQPPGGMSSVRGKLADHVGDHVVLSPEGAVLVTFTGTKSSYPRPPQSLNNSPGLPLHLRSCRRPVPVLLSFVRRYFRSHSRSVPLPSTFMSPFPPPTLFPSPFPPQTLILPPVPFHSSRPSDPVTLSVRCAFIDTRPYERSCRVLASATPCLQK